MIKLLGEAEHTPKTQRNKIHGTSAVHNMQPTVMLPLQKAEICYVYKLWNKMDIAYCYYLKFHDRKSFT